MSKKFLDLSVSLEEGIKSDPDFMLPKINYHHHKETAEEMMSFFPGLKKTDLGIRPHAFDSHVLPF